MEYQTIAYEKKNNIAWITLDRPEKLNAMNDVMLSELDMALATAEPDLEVKVVVIRGKGQCFSVGQDLGGVGTSEIMPPNPRTQISTKKLLESERRRNRRWEYIFNMAKPTIAQVHGFCIGAGEAVACSCDLIVATNDSQFGLRGFGKFLPNGLSNLPLWPYGSMKTHGGQMLPEISGEKAAALGLINQAVHPDKLDEEVDRWAQLLCLPSPEALAITKEWINGILDITGSGTSWRSHYGSHLMLQYVRFHPDEVSLYKVRREKGLKGFFVERASSATPSATHPD